MRVKIELKKHRWSLLLGLLPIVALVFLFFQRGYEHRFSYLSGDEPHYIMLTDSLVKDGDFNLKNDYYLHRSQAYYPYGDLMPHVSALTGYDKPAWYSIHSIGLPLIMAIPYWLGGVRGARVELILIQFVSVVIFYFLLKRYLPSAKQRWLGVGLLLVCPLLWQNIGAIFPDLVLVTLWGLSLLIFTRTERYSNALLGAVFLLAGISHTKGFLLIGPVVAANALWLISTNGVLNYLKRYAITVAGVLIGLVAYVLFIHGHYGVYNPAQLYSIAGGHGQLFTGNPLVNTVAIITDRSKGLLIGFPLILVIGPYAFKTVAAFWRFLKKQPLPKLRLNESHFLIGGVSLGLLVLFVTQIGFLDWSGSTAPNGRYMLPFVFTAIFLVARYADLRSRFEQLTLGAIGLVSLALSWVSIVDFINYMTTGVSSWEVGRFHPLVHLPLFQLTATDQGHGALVRGSEILFVTIIGNIVLIILYTYRFNLTIKKRPR